MPVENFVCWILYFILNFARRKSTEAKSVEIYARQKCGTTMTLCFKIDGINCFCSGQRKDEMQFVFH